MADIHHSVYGGLFDSTEVVETVGGFPVGDKAVDAAFFAKMVACFYADGVWGTDSFRVTPGGGMTISVAPGLAWIGGYMAWLQSEDAFSLSAGESLSLVLRLNIPAGTFTLTLTDAAPIHSGSIRDLVLAEVAIPTGTSAITAAMITDTRGDTSKCGFVTSTVDALRTVEVAEDANMLGGTAAADYLKRTGGMMTGSLRASPDVTGQSVVRNIAYGTVLPDSLPDGELFVLLSDQ